MQRLGQVERTAGAVRAELARRGWSQTQLADLLGVNQSWVSRRLRAQQPFDVGELDRVAAAMNVPISLLLGEDDPRPVRRAAS